MKKRILAAIIAVVLALALMGCHVSTSTTKTETHTDANGTTTTTTTTKTTENGTTTENTTTVVEEAEVAEEAEDEVEHTVATITFVNHTGMDVYELYFASSLSDKWSENAIAEGESLVDGDYITFEDAFTYSEDDLLWDLQIVDVDGNEFEFPQLDVSAAEDAENISIVIAYVPEIEALSAYVE